MMTAEERKRFDELRAQVPCTKKFSCMGAALADLCQGVYHSELDILECLEKTALPCQFTRPFSDTQVCLCPMRKFIAQNFDKWSAEDTGALR
jgi:hypothetical protein